MKKSRRAFFLNCASLFATGGLKSMEKSSPRQPVSFPIKLGVIGTGSRGRHLLRLFLKSGKVKVTALCDINRNNLSRAIKLVRSEKGGKPISFSRDENDWQNLCALNNLDAILVATPIDLHSKMASFALRAGKHLLSEVPAAITLEGCWDIVRAEKESGRLYMLSENCCWWRHILAIQHMISLNLFGELTYAECGYVHDCRNLLIGPDNKPTWRGGIMGTIVGNAYPTHAIGPVARWFDICRTDRFVKLVAMMNGHKSLQAFLDKRLQKENPWRSGRLVNGDSTTVLIQTARGRTIDLRYDIVSPRPHPQTTYYALQGTKGSYESRRDSIWLQDRSKTDKWEDFNGYQEKYEHPLWGKRAKESQGSGHGGADFFTVNAFLDALNKGYPSPIGAVEAATWSAITPLSGKSITQKNSPVEFPDFSRV